jgi:hypothetical protein
VIHTGATVVTDNTGTLSLVAGTQYSLTFEILRNDLGQSSEKVTDVLVAGNSIGGECNPDGGDQDCTFYQCPYAPYVFTASSSSVNVNMQL